MSARRSRILHIVFLLSMSTLCAGCVKTEKRDFFKYDEKTDAFDLLRIFTNIKLSSPEDSDRLATIWKRRDSILFNPTLLDLFADFAGPSIYFKKSKNSYVLSNFDSIIDFDGDVQRTNVDLDSIRIVPGELYVTPHQGLNYFHRIVVPGAIVDRLIDEFQPKIADSIGKYAEERLKAANRQGVDRTTWDDARKEIVAQILDDEKSDSPEAHRSAPFEPASLRMLLNAVADSSFTIRRAGAEIELVAPMTNRDAREVVKTFDYLNKKTAERIKIANADKNLLCIQKVLNTLVFRVVANPGVEITVKPSIYFAAAEEDFDPAPANAKNVTPISTIRQIEARGVKINRSFSIHELAKEFGAR